MLETSAMVLRKTEAGVLHAYCRILLSAAGRVGEVLNKNPSDQAIMQQPQCSSLKAHLPATCGLLALERALRESPIYRDHLLQKCYACIEKFVGILIR